MKVTKQMPLLGLWNKCPLNAIQMVSKNTQSEHSFVSVQGFRHKFHKYPRSFVYFLTLTIVCIALTNQCISMVLGFNGECCGQLWVWHMFCGQDL